MPRRGGRPLNTPTPGTQAGTAAGSPATIRRRLRVTGQVQGVWFRESTRREAERLGVRGWVRNCTDGSVEAVLEGDAGPVAELVRWSRSGPPRAHVLAVELSEEEPLGEPGFRVR
ncbi:MAG TPA: acylphosphatase [Acidimicrobiales bacterium]|nr:acylphosphatase [Acidimicrobiales bacterium]